MSFQIKYLKYKNKYLDLKNLVTQKGGSSASSRQIIDSRQITEYLDSEKYDFQLFDINYTEQEQESIDNFKIEKRCSYTHNGSLTGINDLNTFLSDIGHNTKKDVDNLEQIILNLIEKVLEGYNMEDFLLIIRARTPDSEFDIPRWHRDGPYFDHTIITSKFATVLKGPGTLFIKSSTSNSEQFNEINDREDEERRLKRERIGIRFTHEEQREIDERYRTIYASLPKNSDMVQSGKNQGVIFFADSGGVRGAIHSEPKIDENRIFISIVPGTKENIDERIRSEEMYMKMREAKEK
jgi:hypothetical protein